MLELVPAGFEERDVDGGLELAAYLEDDAEVEALVSVLRDASVTKVEAGWEERWRSFHRSVTVAGIWVGPPWERAPDDQLGVVIDPGRAFGTGSHPTTRAALELLARAPRGSLVDLGSGSGVLAIAGAKLGFSPVLAVDFDPVAVAVTIANASVNGVEIEVREANVCELDTAEADVAVANILLPVVEALAPRVTATHLVTSGYYAADAPFMTGWHRVDRVEVEGWVADAWRRTS